MLTGKNIRKSFGNVEIIRGIDICLQPGTITTVIGPSGCGKTTLLRALALLDPPTAGEVCVDDESFVFPSSVSPTSYPIWPRVTVVFQQLFLWPHLSIRQNAVLPLETRGDAAADERVATIIDDFGIGKFADRYPNEVSTGQRQLGALVRALALDPSYLLLDEVTSALDVEYISQVLACLKRLRSQGVGLLVVSHLINFAKNSADQIVFLDAGEVIESGPPALLEKPGTDRLERFLGKMFEAR